MKSLPVVYRDALRKAAAAVVRVGRWPLPRSPDNWIDVFDDDVFLVSYPRSGNTWVRLMLRSLAVRSRRVGASSTIEDVVPDIYAHSNAELRSRPQPRILKSHEPLRVNYPRVIYLVRNPRDVVVSYYHWSKKSNTKGRGHLAGVASFAEAMVVGEAGPYGSWGDHVGGWVGSRKGSGGFLLVRYEDLVTDAKAELKRMAHFLGLDTEELEFDRAVRETSFERLQAMEASQKRLERLRGSNRRSHGGMFRQGRVGTWFEELPEDSVQVLEEAWSWQMNLVGYEPRAGVPEQPTLALSGSEES